MNSLPPITLDEITAARRRQSGLRLRTPPGRLENGPGETFLSLYGYVPQ